MIEQQRSHVVEDSNEQQRRCAVGENDN